MSHRPHLRNLGLALAAGLVLAVPAEPQTRPSRPTYRLEPVAETRLLMDGLTRANFEGLEKLLKERPADAEAWVFARGQALLIAETGNLLMLRPPRNEGQDAWLMHATHLRTTATDLARTLAQRDLARSRLGLVALAGTCNRCHQSFRIPVRVAAFGRQN